jgi:thiol-disulfide isomerase/thioredoxin
MRRFAISAALVMLWLSAALAIADDAPAGPDEKFGDTPELDKIDFPPGVFSDGGHYRLSDFRGKVLVIYFYDLYCPTATSLVPKRNDLAERYRDKPVRFIGVAPHTSLPDTRVWYGETHLGFPSFIDSLGIMEQRFNIDISLQNIYQTRIIDGDGKQTSTWDEPRKEDIDSALKSASWKYNLDDYDPRLASAIGLLEWNQFESGMRLLKPYLKNISKTGDSAKKLFAVVKVEGQAWADEAKSCETSDPGHALDLYTRLSACFPGDELGTSATASIKTMKADKALQNELAARMMFNRLYAVLPQANATAKPQVIAYCNSIAQKYPDTATAKRAQRLASDLQSAPTPHDE